MESKEKLQITKGRCVKTPINSSSWQLLIDSRVIAHVTSLYSSEKETESNADLYVDAHNTYNQCDLLPSELLEQRNELMGIIDGLPSLLGSVAEILEMNASQRNAESAMSPKLRWREEKISDIILKYKLESNGK